MAEARIRFATDILRRLGEELNPSLDQGVIELVKNAYDADARRCEIELVGTDQPGGTIRVTDDGRGMTAQEIENGFLVLGRSIKSPRRLTPGGRIPAGSKGLGRLAALRMGRWVELSTRPAMDPPRELRLAIDWDSFEHAALVDDVTLTVEVEARRRGAAPGTTIELRQLRRRVRRMEVKRLARSLILLADPFADDESGFSPTLSAREFDDLEGLVRRRYFDDAEFHLVSEIDDQGLASGQVLDWRGETLFEADHATIAVDRNGEPYESPPARFDLWVFLLSREAFRTRATSLGEVKAWLDAFGGVHVYVNRLRVAPYGNPGDDWLELNLRRAQNPEERPSTNTSIGRVSVIDPDEKLLQKTDRSGIVEDHPFLDLRAFAQDATEWMARERLRVAERRRKQERQKSARGADKAREQVQEVIERASPKRRSELSTAFRRYDRARDREAETLRREVQLYRTLSTAGITAATFAHEAASNPVKLIDQAVKTIARRGRKSFGEEFIHVVGSPLETIRRAVRSLAVLSAATLRLVDHEKRRVGRVDVHEVIDSVLGTFEPFLVGRDVKVRTELASAEPYLRAAPAALESIITNLLNNSVAAFERAGVTDREIVVRTQIVGSTLVLQVLDSGPGIDGVDLRDIWTPGITTQPNGTGLGLTIVRDAVSDLSGSVSAAAHGDLGGAEIDIELPLIGW